MKREKFSNIYTKSHLQRLYYTMTQEELSKETGFCTKQIYRYLKKWNIEKRARGRSCPWHILNEDNELINYLGGFLYADGHISKTFITGYTVRLVLAKKDKVIIDMFLNKIDGTKKMEFNYKGYEMVGLIMCGIDLPDKLLKFGITTDKRYGWTRPKVSDSMLPHFLRGWYDGDGWIS